MVSSTRTWLAPPRRSFSYPSFSDVAWNYTSCSRSVYSYSFSNRQIIFMDIFKGADNPFALFQRDSVSGWHSLTLVQYCTCTCIFADRVTFKDILPFIAVSGKDWATSNLNDNLHVHVLYFLTCWPLFVIFGQLVVNSLMNTFLFLLNILIIPMIVRIAGWNVTFQ